MKNPFLKTPLLLNIGLLVITGIISVFTLLFGLAHAYEGITQAIEGTSPDIPASESLLGSIIVCFLCVIGIGAIVVAIAITKAIFSKKKALESNPTE